MNYGALETVRDEDFVEYFLFFRPNDSSNDDAEELVKHINHLNTKVLEFVDRLSGQYIWHKDRINLIPRFCPSAELRQSFPDTSDGKNKYLPSVKRFPPKLSLLYIIFIAFTNQLSLFDRCRFFSPFQKFCHPICTV